MNVRVTGGTGAGVRRPYSDEHGPRCWLHGWRRPVTTHGWIWSRRRFLVGIHGPRHPVFGRGWWCLHVAVFKPTDTEIHVRSIRLIPWW